jgi:hypothetical protein
LIDVQPRIAPMVLEIEHATRRRPLGLAHNAASFHEDLRLALLEVDRLVEAGRLAPTRREDLEMEFRFDALEDWREFVTRPHAGHVEADVARLAEAERGLARGDTAIVATESQGMMVFRRPP